MMVQRNVHLSGQTINTWGYPAKDRSGYLNMVEEPHLGRLLAKIKAKTLASVA